MTSLNTPQPICGLGNFAKDAAKAGYTNPNGTVNLLEAQAVCKEFGKLVPKNELDPKTLAAIEEAGHKIAARTNPKTDSFVKD